MKFCIHFRNIIHVFSKISFKSYIDPNFEFHENLFVVTFYFMMTHIFLLFVTGSHSR